MEIDNIYNMDCLEGMKQIPDGTIDAVICDLPYGTMKGMGKGTQYEGKTEWDEHHTDRQTLCRIRQSTPNEWCGNLIQSGTIHKPPARISVPEHEL